MFLGSDRALHYSLEGSLTDTTDPTTTCTTELDSRVGGIQPAKWQSFVAERSAQTALPYHSVRGEGRESGERVGRNGRSRRVWKEEGEKNGM